MSDAKLQSNIPFPKIPIQLPGKAEQKATPLIFWPVVMLFFSVSVALLCWQTYNALPQIVIGAEKHLRKALFSPKFNPTGAEAPGVEIPELLPEPELAEPAVVTVATGEPPLLAPPMMKVELPLVPVPLAQTTPPLDFQPVRLRTPELPPLQVQVAATNPLVYLALSSGDTPMLRNWKTLALYSLLTTTVFVQVPAPAVADEKDNTPILDRIDTLQKEMKKSFGDAAADMVGIKMELQSQKVDLQKIRTDIEGLKDDGLKQRLEMAGAKAKIKDLENALDKLRIDLEAPRNREPIAGKLGIDRESVEEIKAKLSAIEQAILKLQPSTNRIAMSPPVTSANGRVVLINLYPEELLFVVNQKSYRVPPGANQPIENVSAGPLNYEVISGTWGLRARNTTSLAPNETFTVTAR